MENSSSVEPLELCFQNLALHNNGVSASSSPSSLILDGLMESISQILLLVTDFLMETQSSNQSPMAERPVWLPAKGFYGNDSRGIKTSRKIAIFQRVFDFIFELMIHRNGNYLFQKLIESVDEIRLQMILEKLTVPENHIYPASVHKYGSFSVRKLIRILGTSPLISYVIKALSIEFEKLMTDRIGWYTIMECLNVLDSQANDVFYVRAMDLKRKRN